MTPTTLPALRAAVARVLDVAGQRETVTDVTTAPCGWSPWHPDDADITVAVTLTTTGRILERRGRDEAHAVARLWEAVLDAVWARAADTRRQRVMAERRGGYRNTQQTKSGLKQFSQLKFTPEVQAHIAHEWS